jgi:lysine-specific histone demethylase 1
VFVGGITFTEIAALRFIAKQEEGKHSHSRQGCSETESDIAPTGRRNIVICTTSIINGNKMMESAIEKESFAKESVPVSTT